MDGCLYRFPPRLGSLLIVRPCGLAGDADPIVNNEPPPDGWAAPKPPPGVPKPELCGNEELGVAGDAG